MSGKLISSLNRTDVNYENPANRDDFFSRRERDLFDEFSATREQLPCKTPFYGCDTNLFMGFFFDGTRNNYERSLKNKDQTHTNVARLYSAYPGRSVPGVLPRDTDWATDSKRYKNFFRVYVPGVGTPFSQVEDSGSGWDALAGNALSRLGERRIVWALVQALNNLHRFFHGDKAPLIDEAETLALCRRIQLGWQLLGESVISPAASKERREARGPWERHQKTLEELVLRLRAALKPFMPAAPGLQPAQSDPGVVQRIYLSVFGFSRGAAEARVFANFFLQLCWIDAAIGGQSRGGEPTLAGFPVTFDFLGLFDTVASVGLASSTLFADGHGAWADAEHSLRIPSEVRKCLHLVAALEIRRSFPLDSVHVGTAGGLAANAEERVVPGVHSDVGGGYPPGEQWRGTDLQGSDQLSRVSLNIMYRAARLHGVPLKLELSRAGIQRDFALSPALVADLNAYLAAFEKASSLVAHPGQVPTALTQTMRAQRRSYILWRKQIAPSLPATLETLPKPLRTDALREADRLDLVSANESFQEEVKSFETWLKWNPPPTAAVAGQGWPGVGNYEEEPSRLDARAIPQAGRRPPSLDAGHQAEWELIRIFWNDAPPAAEVQSFYEKYVHDSFAWFKVTGTEAEDMHQKMLTLMHRVEHTPPGEGDTVALRWRRERAWIAEYERTNRLPPEFAGGREPAWAGAGYLRFRRIYAGADGWRLTRNDSTYSAQEMSTAA